MAATAEVHTSLALAETLGKQLRGLEPGQIHFTVQGGQVPYVEFTFPTSAPGIVAEAVLLAHTLDLRWGQVSYRVQANGSVDRLDVSRKIDRRDLGLAQDLSG
jgi:hypothetical protein